MQTRYFCSGERINSWMSCLTTWSNCCLLRVEKTPIFLASAHYFCIKLAKLRSQNLNKSLGLFKLKLPQCNAHLEWKRNMHSKVIFCSLHPLCLEGYNPWDRLLALFSLRLYFPLILYYYSRWDFNFHSHSIDWIASTYL